jgi:cytochrome b6-f complex iron-sulfur subunit
VDSSTVIVIAVAAVLALALVMIVATGRKRAGSGRLSRETRRRDASEPPPGAEPSTALAPIEPGEEELDAAARARADESRELVPAGAGAPAKYEPVDEEELGLSRRQFFNRGILVAMGGAVSAFGVAALGFLWPSGSGGFGGVIRVGSTADVQKAFDAKEPFYNAAAKTYIVPYPTADIENAKSVYPPTIVSGMEEGFVALYQKCVHLGCRVPWCETSQWFECPCHGSKYNRVGEKRGGPAPRGLDRFGLTVSGGGIEVDTGTVFTGPPIGTDTTGQSAEGAPCV